MTANEPLRLSLAIPGLFGPAALKHTPSAWQGVSLPALEELLSRAKRGAAGDPGLEQTLFTLFKIKTAGDADLPVAAVTRQWDAQDAAGYWWLRADPVHLRADRDRLVMLGNTLLNISGEEGAQLAAELNRHFKDEGWNLEATNARRWYLRLAGDPHVRSDVLPEVVGQDILHHMPRGPDERRWRGVLNEAQMVLHASAVNRFRETQGELPVNSLWFWGGGVLPQVPQGEWSQVWGNDALTQGLASLARVPCATLPESAAEWLEEGAPGEHLIVLDGLREKSQFGNVEGWLEFLQTLQDYWLAPLFAALKQGGLAALILYPADGAAYKVTARDAKRWWVRRRALAAWL